MSDYAEAAATATENYEAEPAGDPAPVEAGAAAAPTPSTVQDDAGDVPSSGEGAAPTWTGVTQDEWTALQQRQAELEQQLQQQPRFDPYTGQPLDNAQQAPEIPEPWDPEYGEKMTQYLDYRDEQTRNQMRPFIEPVMTERAEKDMTDSVTRAAQAIGFDVAENPQRMDAVAGIAQALGSVMPGRTDEAYATSAQFVSELVKAERDAAVTAYKESLQRGNGQAEPGATGAGIAAPGLAGSYDEIVESYLADPGRPVNAW